MKVQNPSILNTKTITPTNTGGINIPVLCNTLLRIVAYLEESQYTEENKCKTDVGKHIDPASPASDVTTSQG